MRGDDKQVVFANDAARTVYIAPSAAARTANENGLGNPDRAAAFVMSCRREKADICWAKRPQKNQPGYPGDLWGMDYDQALARKAGRLRHAAGLVVKSGRRHSSEIVE